MSLFEPSKVVGAFRGFSEGGLEFHADLVLPHNPDFQRTAMHGQFVIVGLEHDGEAVLGRITTISSEGRLVSPVGEDFAARAVMEDRVIPEDLRERFLKYKIDIRVLGVVRENGDKVEFAASHRRLPHVGAKVGFLSDALLTDLAGARDEDGAEIGFLALGEFIYSAQDPRLRVEPWMRVVTPSIVPRFDVSSLTSRRTFVFARAGFGKSNLIKLLFADLYLGQPEVERRGGSHDPVGTVIFDPEGEYFWPDYRGRPGLCDVPHLRDKLVVFTNRAGPSEAYGSFVVDRVRLDIRELPASRVATIVLPIERQEQQNVHKIKQTTGQDWRDLVDLIHHDGHAADLAVISRLIGLEHQAGPSVEAIAARSNLVRIVNALHDPTSQLLAKLRAALADGKLCVVDISQMRGKAGLDLAGIVLADLFEHNQNQFTLADPRTIPTIAVIEEAQSVLGGAAANSEGPFVEWVKEGRKYDLGAVLVTQQPGSISHELLSQGDNWFVFHLLSQNDLRVLKGANAHYSDDLLSSLLNEPIVGHGVFWSSARQRPYPLPIRVLDFNTMFEDRLDPAYDQPPLQIYATQLRESFERARREAAEKATAVLADASGGAEESLEPAIESLDDAAIDARCRVAATTSLKARDEFWQRLEVDDLPWWQVQQWLSEYAPLPETDGTGRFQWAFGVVPEALNELLGRDGWRSDRRPDPRARRGDRPFIVATGRVTRPTA